MGDLIEVGDKVTVQFGTHPPINGTVLYSPAATGDSWHIRDEYGMLVYIQQFDYMKQQPPSEEGF